MTKADLVRTLAATWGDIPNGQANERLASFVTFIAGTVKKEKVLKIPALGTFRLRQSKARTGRNPQTGAPIKIPARKKVGFTPAKVFKETVLGGK